MVTKKEDTPERIARRKYEQEHKEQRQQKSGDFQTMIPRELYEEINSYLKENNSIFYMLPALNAPTLMLAKGDTKTTAAWTAVEGASGYEVTYPDGSTEIVTTTSVEFTPVNEIADVVKVRALGVSGVSSDSDYATLKELL